MTEWWIAWVMLTLGSFAYLEWQGLKETDDEKYTLTNRIRALMRTSPVARIVLASGIGLLLAWLFQHFLLVDPTQHPGA